MMQHPLWLVVAASAIALIPIVIGLLTSYVKISVVLGMLKSGLGAQQVPSGLVIMVLSLAMTAFIMGPVIGESARRLETVDRAALSRAPDGKDFQTISYVLEPWRGFMQLHAGKREVLSLENLALQQEVKGQPIQQVKLENGTSQNETPMRILIPAFVLTEIKEGFAMGFVLLLPFLVIDLIVGNVLAGMGMYMLSPTMISLPLKLILFVLADGWILLTKGLVMSYQG